MDEPMMPGGVNQLLKVLLLFLVIAAVIFFLKFAGKGTHPLPGGEQRRPLELLEKAFQLRQKQLGRRYEEKIRNAPNEIMSVKYQQELGQEQDQAKERYFQDKQSILKGDYAVLEAHWGEEIKRLQTAPGAP